MSGVMLDTALTKPGDGSGHQDDIHEIILPEEEFDTEQPLTCTAEPVTEEAAQTQETPEFDFEKIQIRGVHQVNINDGREEKWQTEDRALEPWDPSADSAAEEENPVEESTPGGDFFWNGDEDPAKEELLFAREVSEPVPVSSVTVPEETVRDGGYEDPVTESAAPPAGEVTPEEEETDGGEVPQNIPDRADSRPRAVCPGKTGASPEMFPAVPGAGNPRRQIPGNRCPMYRKNTCFLPYPCWRKVPQSPGIPPVN